MKRNKFSKLYMGLLLCMACASMTACGSSDKKTETALGRATSISDTQIEIEAFANMDSKTRDNSKRPDGHRPVSGGAIASGGAVGGPKDFANKKSNDSNFNDKAFKGKEPASGSAVGSRPEKPEEEMERKTFVIDSDTKIYKQNGDEQEEITVDDIQLGDNVEIAYDSDGAESIIVKNKTK